MHLQASTVVGTARHSHVVDARRFVRSRLHRHCHDVLSVSGRPGKRPDVCYAWWILTTTHLVDTYLLSNAQDDTPPSQLLLSNEEAKAAVQGILECQHVGTGGFSRAAAPASSNTASASLQRDAKLSGSSAGTILSALSGKSSGTEATEPDAFHSYFALASLSQLWSVATEGQQLGGLVLVDARTTFPVQV